MLTPTGTITYTYTWTVPTGVATSTTKTVSTSKAGTYSLTITDANSCISEVGTGSVTVNPIPTFNILSPSVCSGSQLKITANPLTGASTDYNYTWQVPTGVANPGNVSNFTTTIAGVYTATIKNKTTACESLSSNAITSFYPLPSAAAIVANNNKVIVNKTLNLTAAASGGKNPYYFTWTPNPTINYSISGQENAVFTALKEGKVKFKYQVKDANNCEVNSADYEITIESEDIILILPNAFTPNGDGNNDIFKIVSSNMLGKASFRYFEIYNRNGKLMGKRYNNINEGWDGKDKDVIQDMGIYFVKLARLDKDGKQVVDNAQFYLLK
jgi:gliding motility-associated-like protein